jgi:glycosyltransferase involved in cell wall biosynthesis
VQPPETTVVERPDAIHTAPLRARAIRVVFCWAEVSGYMAACWRALVQRPGIEVHVLHPQRLWGKTNPFLSDPLILQGISNEAFKSDAPDVDQSLIKAIAGWRADVLVLCGWIYKPYSRIVNSSGLRHARVIVGMDSPWRGTLAQRLARFRLAGLVRRLDLVVTSGERSWEYARRIGVPENRIRSGYYGFDHELFSQVASGRSPVSGEWPRQFLFVGRYVPQKDLATLMKAYSSYRASVSQPWGLTCCGAGIDAELLKGVPGVVDAGFTHPRNLPSVFSRHGVFVLPSRFEPWGVVLAEAAASGLPMICTSACGSGVDLVRPYYNGLVVAPQDVSGLARAMRWIHQHESELPAMGRRSQALAEAYSAEAWATRWHNYLLDALEESAPHPS